MPPATVLFGIGCVGALWLSRRDDLRLTLAFALFYVWMVASLAYHVDALIAMVWVDVLVAGLAACLGRGAAPDEIVVLSAARVGLHIASAMGAPYEAFAWAYNATFAAMLASVSINGGIAGGLRDCSRAWRNRGRRGGDGTFRLTAHLAALAGA